MNASVTKVSDPELESLPKWLAWQAQGHRRLARNAWRDFRASRDLQDLFSLRA